jgi:hypothetical protein
MNQKDGVEFATTTLLSTGVRLHYAERGDPGGKPSSSSTATVIRGSPSVGFSPCSRPPTMPSRSPSADTGTQINRSAATRHMTTPPMSTPLWRRLASKKPPSSALRREPFLPNE